MTSVNMKEQDVAGIETNWSWSKFATIVCFALAAAMLLFTLMTPSTNASVSKNQAAPSAAHTLQAR